MNTKIQQKRVDCTPLILKLKNFDNLIRHSKYLYWLFCLLLIILIIVQELISFFLVNHWSELEERLKDFLILHSFCPHESYFSFIFNVYETKNSSTRIHKLFSRNNLRRRNAICVYWCNTKISFFKSDSAAIL